MDSSVGIYGYYILDIMNILDNELNNTSHNPSPTPTQHTPDQHTNINKGWVQKSTQNITKKQGLNVTGPCVIIFKTPNVKN